MSAIGTALQLEELDSLRQIDSAAAQIPIPKEHSETLVRLGFAKVRAGALVITIGGRGKLAIELTRASWLREPD